MSDYVVTEERLHMIDYSAAARPPVRLDERVEVRKYRDDAEKINVVVGYVVSGGGRADFATTSYGLARASFRGRAVGLKAVAR